MPHVSKEKLTEKLKQREYRPWQVLYTPVYLSYIRNSIKQADPLYVYDANPGMPPVGFLKFSKWKILQQVSEQYRPKTFFLASSEYVPIEEIESMVKQLGDYPVIVKPDLGERGTEVLVAKNATQLNEYCNKNRTQDLLLQQFIDSPIEMGVFYYRYPTKDSGHISGITIKEFFVVTGNGNETLRQLVEKDERGVRYSELFAQIQGDKYDSIIPQGEEVQLNHIGNHCKGTKFLNGNHVINKKLVSVFDAISKQISGFYYGRFDIKVTSYDDLYDGKGISVLEVNGVQSEPTHIYDPASSLSYGIKELMKHRQIMYEIAKENRSNTPPSRVTSIIDHYKDQQILHKSEKYQPKIASSLGSLPELIDAINQHITWQVEVYKNIDLQRCQYILDLYHGSDRRDKVTYNPDHYTRYAVQLPDTVEHFDLYLLGWDSNQMSKIHDHASNGCIMKFLHGEFIENNYLRIDSGFRLQKHTTYSMGQSAFIRDDLGYHAIGTHEDSRGASLHVYSPSRYKTKYFDDGIVQ